MEKFNLENSKLILEKLSRLGKSYHPNSDSIQSPPNGNWVDILELMGCINLLLKRVEDLEWEVINLNSTIQSLQTDRPDYEN